MVGPPYPVDLVAGDSFVFTADGGGGEV
ncbi:uncharacterized protein G2W53_005971 [Senna tora]|uniref:Uncharacterized protein n=1 Tax=Senna tora TaxID=362788 RepID=A0A834X3V7_9FABA|nr:uncharacterized protein G2W53_005971 [Senna tora]